MCGRSRKRRYFCQWDKIDAFWETKEAVILSRDQKGLDFSF